MCTCECLFVCVCASSCLRHHQKVERTHSMFTHPGTGLGPPPCRSPRWVRTSARRANSAPVEHCGQRRGARRSPTPCNRSNTVTNRVRFPVFLHVWMLSGSSSPSHSDGLPSHHHSLWTHKLRSPPPMTTSANHTRQFCTGHTPRQFTAPGAQGSHRSAARGVQRNSLVLHKLQRSFPRPTRSGPHAPEGQLLTGSRFPRLRNLTLADVTPDHVVKVLHQGAGAVSGAAANVDSEVERSGVLWRTTDC